MCDDGGALIICTHCHAACCYNESTDEGLVDRSDAHLASEACITLPKGYAKDILRVFRCPMCFADRPDKAMDVSVLHLWLCCANISFHFRDSDSTS